MGIIDGESLVAQASCFDLPHCPFMGLNLPHNIINKPTSLKYITASFWSNRSTTLLPGIK
jgi:hypothetical protein